MEDRIRQILMEQVAMRGGEYEDYVGGAPIKGKHYAKMKAAAKKRWGTVSSAKKKSLVSSGTTALAKYRKIYNLISKAHPNMTAEKKRQLASQKYHSSAKSTKKTTVRKTAVRKTPSRRMSAIASLKKMLNPGNYRMSQRTSKYVTQSDLACLNRLGFNETEARKLLRSRGLSLRKSNNLKGLAYNRLV